MTQPSNDVTPPSALDLLRKLEETEGEWAKGATRFAEGGLFDTQRKIELDKRCVLARMNTEAKQTETAITQIAHSHPDYVHYVEQAAREREAWLLLDAQRKRWALTLALMGPDKDVGYSWRVVMV